MEAVKQKVTLSQQLDQWQQDVQVYIWSDPRTYTIHNHKVAAILVKDWLIGNPSFLFKLGNNFS